MPSRKKDEKGLTDREYLVIDEYFRHDMDKKAACLAAGYAETTARDHPEYIFDRPAVRKEIDRRMEARRKKYELDEQWVIERLMKIADANLTDLMVIGEDGRTFHFDFNRLTPELSFAISEVQVDEVTVGRGEDAEEVRKVKIKPSDKMAALTALARHLGLFKDRIEVQGELSILDRLRRGRERMNQENADGSGADT